MRTRPVGRYRYLYKYQRGLCCICFHPMTWEEASKDHVKPKSQGGQGRGRNILLAHAKCNSKRGGAPYTQASLKFCALVFDIQRKETILSAFLKELSYSGLTIDQNIGALRDECHPPPRSADREPLWPLGTTSQATPGEGWPQPPQPHSLKGL